MKIEFELYYVLFVCVYAHRTSHYRYVTMHVCVFVFVCVRDGYRHRRLSFCILHLHLDVMHLWCICIEIQVPIFR